MGEQSLTPNHNDNLPEKMDSTENVNESEQYDNEDISPEEFSVIDSQLDALNSALDDIERKNSDIYSQLMVLLQENRQIRVQMQQDSDATNSTDISPQ